MALKRKVAMFAYIDEMWQFMGFTLESRRLESFKLEMERIGTESHTHKMPSADGHDTPKCTT